MHRSRRVALFPMLAGLVGVALVAGCHRTTPPSPRVPPVTAVREASLDGGLILVELLAPLLPDGPKPAVIMPAGFELPVVPAGGIAVWYRIDWRRLAQAPSLDLSEPEAGGQPAPTPASGEAFFHRLAIVADTVLPRILDWLEALPDVDPGRLGLAASGADALAALAAAARDQRVAAVAVPFACGDWERIAAASGQGEGGVPVALDPGYAAWLRAESPLADPGRLVPTPVLLASRPGDASVPPSCVEATYAALAPAYAAAGAAERLRHERLAAGDDGREVAFAWMRRWLLVGRRRPQPGIVRADDARELPVSVPRPPVRRP